MDLNHHAFCRLGILSPVRLPISPYPVMVGVKRLELPAPWSQTTCATNCATPRYCVSIPRLSGWIINRACLSIYIISHNLIYVKRFVTLLANKSHDLLRVVAPLVLFFGQNPLTRFLSLTTFGTKSLLTQFNKSVTNTIVGGRCKIRTCGRSNERRQISNLLV